MPENSDPRVYFAAERTLLAWVRTGLTVMGLGFVVARFGLFLRVASQRGDTAATHFGSTVIGVVLVLLGSAAVGLAAWQHVRFCRGLNASERPASYWSVWFSLVLSVVGFGLAIYVLLQR